MINRFDSELTKVDHFLRGIARPFVPVVGLVDWRLGRDYDTGIHDVNIARTVAKPGYVIISRTKFNASNLTIPGFWKHAAFVLDDSSVIEAIGTGVQVTALSDFILTCDYYAVLKPNFADQQRRERAVGFAAPLEGLPYDGEFCFTLSNNTEFFCSEIIWWSYEKTYDGPGEFSPFTPKKILGKYTILPQDFANAYWKWQVECTNRPDKIPQKDTA